jgi:hypothetical protein
MCIINIDICIPVSPMSMSNHEFHKVLPRKKATSHGKAIRESP